MGGRIIINSDSHQADNIGFCFEEAARLAAECGFTHTLARWFPEAGSAQWSYKGI